MSYIDVVSRVDNAVGAEVLQDIVQFISRQEVTLWGSHKPRYFLQATLRLALYYDLEEVGYCGLTHFRDLPCLINHKSLYCNVTVLLLLYGRVGTQPHTRGLLS